jgi:hypothetical protein
LWNNNKRARHQRLPQSREQILEWTNAVANSGVYLNSPPLQPLGSHGRASGENSQAWITCIAGPGG